MIMVFYPPLNRPFAWLSGQKTWERSLTESVTEGNARRQILFTLLGLVAVGRLAFRRKTPPDRVVPNLLGWLFTLFAILTLASALWSDEPMLTVRRLVALAIVGLAAFAYRRDSGDAFLRLVFFTTLAALVYGLVREVARGTFHPWDPDYRFMGTLLSPNMQGWTCALAVLSGLALVHGLRRWRLAAALVIPLACLVLTRSRTSLAALFGATLFYAFLFLLRKLPSVLVASLCLAATAVVSVVWIGQTSPRAEDAFTLGRQGTDLATLQGRTEVWEKALVYVRARPWLGYGHDSFWSMKQIEDFSADLRWTVPNAHSNYLDVLLGLGVIGLFVFVGVLGVGTWRASRVAVGSGKAADLFIAALLAFCVIHGFLETTLVVPCFLTFLCMTAVVRLGFPGDAQVRTMSAG
jgi:O-antigen ligase